MATNPFSTRPHPFGLTALILLLIIALDACSASRCCDDNGLQFKMDAKPHQTTEGEAVSATTFAISPKPNVSMESVQSFLNAFGFKIDQKPQPMIGREKIQSARGVLKFSNDSGSYVIIDPSTSEFSFVKDTTLIPYREPLRNDSAIRRISDSLLEAKLGEEAKSYAFTNSEKTLKLTDKDTVLRPAFYYGRYVLKLNDRFVLGTGLQTRLGFESGNRLIYFSRKNPLRSESGKETVPSTKSVYDSLQRWSRSKNHPRCLRFMDHPDHPYIVKLRVAQIINSYVEVTTPPDTADTLHVPGKALVPRVTVIAEASLRRMAPPQPNQTAFPLPDPLYLSFHFPCTPETGYCWPDGQREMELPENLRSAPRIPE